MTYYIEKAGTPINTTTFATIADLIASVTAPAWAGAKPTEIKMDGEFAYVSRGIRYTITAGNNPKEARAAARTAMLTAPKVKAHRAYSSKAGWLAREMDRADSDY